MSFTGPHFEEAEPADQSTVTTTSIEGTTVTKGANVITEATMKMITAITTIVGKETENTTVGVAVRVGESTVTTKRKSDAFTCVAMTVTMMMIILTAGHIIFVDVLLHCIENQSIN